MRNAISNAAFHIVLVELIVISTGIDSAAIRAALTLTSLDQIRRALNTIVS